MLDSKRGFNLSLFQTKDNIERGCVSFSLIDFVIMLKRYSLSLILAMLNVTLLTYYSCRLSVGKDSGRIYIPPICLSVTALQHYSLQAKTGRIADGIGFAELLLAAYSDNCLATFRSQSRRPGPKPASGAKAGVRGLSHSAAKSAVATCHSLLICLP